ncbi:hypothetical protein [Acetivibrio straminisolvens]|uniref:hypothetical protein n=1 Tax=Acetivibrio straminisolvens TaxID=253314 RepID=UPI001FB1895B|nr:hypothetical protein [Acetivibrio straminisolvens]
MAKKKVRRKKRNKRFRLFGVILVLLLVTCSYFYFFKNPEENNENTDVTMARIASTVSTPAVTGTSTPVNTLESSPSTEPVVTSSSVLSTDNPQEAENIPETPIVIQQKGASIQVINYTGRKNLAEEIRMTLEGYVYSKLGQWKLFKICWFCNC